MIALFLIALIIDTMITHTFPAYTLIAGIICITINSCKNLLIKEDKKYIEIRIKEQEKNFEDSYNKLELLLNHLEEKEKNLLKRFVDENKKCIDITLNEYTNIYSNLYSQGFNFITVLAYARANKEPYYILEISDFYFEILKKYFN